MASTFQERYALSMLRAEISKLSTSFLIAVYNLVRAELVFRHELNSDQHVNN